MVFHAKGQQVHDVVKHCCTLEVVYERGANMSQKREKMNQKLRFKKTKSESKLEYRKIHPFEAQSKSEKKCELDWIRLILDQLRLIIDFHLFVISNNH